MKKQILSLALVATMIGAIATGCGATKPTGEGSDSTKVDSASTTTPATGTDTTAKPDTTKKDTTKKP